MTSEFCILSGDCPGAGTIVRRIGGDGASVGRHGSVTIPHESVSRCHAVIERREEGWLLSDCGSRNGTFVNGISVARHFLSDGDEVGFGKVVLTFREEAGDPDSPDCEGPDFSEADGDGATLAANPATLAVAGADMRGALGTLRACAARRWRTLEDALKTVAENIAGMRGVAFAEIALLHPLSGEAVPAFAAAGNKNVPYAPAARREMARRAASAGSPVFWRGAEAGAVPRAGCDCAGFPLKLRGAPAGSVLAGSAAAFDTAALDNIESAAEGLEIFLGIFANAAESATGGRTCAHAGAAPVMVGRSESFQFAARMAARAAKSDATVLLFGESGTGKELFARLVYDESSRRGKCFVAVHSSAIEPTLMGSALFGHEKGAFTGAVERKKGLFEEADGGTIFLDEIGELSQEMQVKLLRVLQEGEFMRVGGTETIHVDVRVICATNRNLAEAVREGRFREDLYYRLNVIQIPLPPLRERRDDIPDLARHFAESIGGRKRGVSDAAVRVLAARRWPGNIRELRNAIERALVLSDNDILEPGDFDFAEKAAAAPETSAPATQTASVPDSGETLREVERRHIAAVMERCGGNKRTAAEKLGISRSTLYEKLKELDVGIPDAGVPGNGTSGG